MKKIIIALFAFLPVSAFANQLMVVESEAVETYEWNVGSSVDKETRLSHNFGGVGIGFTRYANLRITNRGQEPLAFQNIRSAGSGFSARTNCPRSLPAGSQCLVEISFRPVFSGYHNGNVWVNFTNSERITVSLSGYGERRL